MPTSTRIKGKSLKFKVNNEEVECDLTAIDLLNEEQEGGDDVETFCDVASGGAVTWYLDTSAITSTDADSYWTFLWDNAGTQNLDYVYAPNGNATPTADQPHFTGTVDLPAKPNIGGEANSTWTFDVRLTCNEEPTKVTA